MGKKGKYFIVLLGLLQLVYLSLNAQLPRRFIQYDIKDGLSQNSVHAIFRDSDGLMWFGTQDGLNSFDGKQFKVYRHSELDITTISDQFVLTIKQDLKGFLWVGTRNGLNRLDKATGKFTRFYTDEADRHRFQAQYENFILFPDGRVLVPGLDLRILEPSTNKVSMVASPYNKKGRWIPLNNFKTYFIDEQQELYAFPDIRKKSFEKIGALPKVSNKTTQFLAFENYKDSLLFLYQTNTSDEILVLDIHDNKFIKSIKAETAIFSLWINGPNDVIASTPVGVIRYNLTGKQEELIASENNNNGIPRGPVLSTYMDNDNNFWIGSAGGGIAVSNKSFDNFVLIAPPLKGDLVTTIGKCRGNLFVGTHNGIYQIKNFNPNIADQKLIPFLYGSNITALAIDEMENIWAGIYNNGVKVFNKNGGLLNTLLTGGGTNVLSITKGLEGTMIVNSTNGLHVYSSTGKLLYSSKQSPNTVMGTYVISTKVMPEATLWVASNRGLSILNADFSIVKEFASGSDTSSFLKRTIVTSIDRDADGNNWIATIRNGIYKFKDGKSTHYNSAQGLGSDVVYNVVCDAEGRPWVNTSTGIAVYNKAANNFTKLTISDGAPNAAIPVGAFLKDNNYLLFGTTEGLLICNASNVNPQSVPINVKISNIKINGENIQNLHNSISLIPDDKLINFELSSYPAYYPGKIIYQYKLDSKDAEWITLPDAVKTISYTGLPHGNLILMVRAAPTTSGLLAAKTFTLSIHSRPPLWKSVWFITLFVLLIFILSGYVVSRYNKKKFQKKLQELTVEQELQNERNRIGRDLHDNIGAYTSALIAGINQIKPTDDHQTHQVKDLKEYGTSIMGFLRETIWMLNTETLTVTAFADRIKNYTIRIGKNYPSINIHIDELIEQERKLPPTQMLNIFRIIQEALQNTFKHADASTVDVKIKSSEYLYFEVKDNGVGFIASRKEGHYGLRNMKERAFEAGFLFDIETNDGGTTVCIKENTANAALQIKSI